MQPCALRLPAALLKQQRARAFAAQTVYYYFELWRQGRVVGEVFGEGTAPRRGVVERDIVIAPTSRVAGGSEAQGGQPLEKPSSVRDA